MKSLDRRDLLNDLLNGALVGAATAALPLAASAQQAASRSPRRPWSVIDANISLFQWPFRRLLAPILRRKGLEG